MSNVDRARELATDAALARHNGEHITDAMHSAMVLAKLEAAIESLNAVIAELKEIHGFESLSYYSALGPGVRITPEAFDMLFASDPLVKETEHPKAGIIERSTDIDGVKVYCCVKANYQLVRT